MLGINSLRKCNYRSMALILFVFFLFQMPANASVISVNVSNSSLGIGDTVNVDFRISGLTRAIGDSLSGFDFDILYDEAAFSLTSYDFNDPVLGNQLDLLEAFSLGFYGDVITTGGGVLDAYGVSGNSDWVLDSDQADEFSFLNLSFRAIAETSSSVFEIDLVDPNLLALDSMFNNLSVAYSPVSASVVVSDASTPTPVPEPATLLLFSMGLLGVCFIRRSKKQ
jgi:hypothetical protein